MKRKITLCTQEEEEEVKPQRQLKQLANTMTQEDLSNEPSSQTSSRFKSFCRVRPFDGVNKSFYKSLEKGGAEFNHNLSVNQTGVKEQLIKDFGSSFAFDYIFDEEYTQLEIFQETCVRLIDELVDSKKSSLVLSQGLNDSGKTFTVIGDTDNPGLLPLCLRLIYDKVKEKKEGIQIYCNFFEIFNKNSAYDLLSNPPKEVQLSNNQWSYIKNVTNYSLENIQDFSNALNISYGRKKMRNGTSLSNTVFKILLRYTDTSTKEQKECSLSIIDTAFPNDKDFVNLTQISLNDKEDERQKQFRQMRKNELYYIQHCLCKIVRSLAERPEKNCKPWFYTTALGKFLREYFYGNKDIVLITSIKPSLDCLEENLKVLFFAESFRKAIQHVDLHQAEHKVENIDASRAKAASPSGTTKKQQDQSEASQSEKLEEHSSEEKLPKLNSSNIFENGNNNSKGLFISKDEMKEMKRKYEELLKKSEKQEKKIMKLLEKMNEEKKKNITDEEKKKKKSNETVLEVSEKVNKNIKDLLTCTGTVIPAGEINDLKFDRNSSDSTSLCNVILINPTIQNLIIYDKDKREGRDCDKVNVKFETADEKSNSKSKGKVISKPKSKSKEKPREKPLKILIEKAPKVSHKKKVYEVPKDQFTSTASSYNCLDSPDSLNSTSTDLPIKRKFLPKSEDITKVKKHKRGRYGRFV